MADFKAARKRLNEELREPIDDRVNFRRELVLHRQRIAAATDDKQRRALAGELGGLVKRWAAFVIEQLTVAILGDRRPGRERVRAWQKTMFGKSCASKALAIYAEEARSGGGRGDLVEVPAEVEAEAQRLFARYIQRFRDL